MCTFAIILHVLGRYRSWPLDNRRLAIAFRSIPIFRFTLSGGGIGSIAIGSPAVGLRSVPIFRFALSAGGVRSVGIESLVRDVLGDRLVAFSFIYH